MSLDQYGECDVTDCDRPATEVIVGEAGDFWLCREHDVEGEAFRSTLGSIPSGDTRMSDQSRCCKCDRPAVVEIAVHVWTLPKRVHDFAVRLYCMKHNPDPLAAEFDVEPVDL